MSYSYLIIKEKNSTQLQQEVIVRAKAGWKCIGGPFMYLEDTDTYNGTKSSAKTYFCQGMEWREEDQKIPKFPTEENKVSEIEKKNTLFQKEEDKNNNYNLNGYNLKIKPKKK